MDTRHSSKIQKHSITLFLSMALLLISLLPTEAQIGVSYGWQGNNLPSCQQVVNIYRSNGIGRMRIYYPDHGVLQALQGSGIKLLLDVPNDQVQNFAQNPSLANQWVQQNVVPYASVISYLAVGNEVDQNIRQYVGPALSNALNALNANGLGNQIKVTTAIGMTLIKNSYPPSAGEFNDLAFMVPIVNFLQQNGSPLLLNVYPYFTYVQNKGTVSQDYALFTSPGIVVTDPNNGLQYQNVYDALVDSVYAALAKLGSNSNSNGPHVRIISSETGWPSGGGDSASQGQAGTYYGHMSHHARNGTPRNPGRQEVYLFSMFDENQKPGDNIERNFGIFTPDGRPKYNGIDFSS